MDLSPWDWQNNFQLHEAACLIVGITPLSKRIPDREELPPQAVPIVLKLSSAYIEWLVRHDKAERPDSPKMHMLEPVRDVDGSAPPMPAPIKNILGELVSRVEINRWLLAVGMPSKYSFGPRSDGASVALSNNVHPMSPEITSLVHSTAPRRTNLLTDVIEEAISRTGGSDDFSRVWLELGAMAAQQVKPFTEAAEGDLKYMDGGEAKFLTRKNLRDRLAYRRKKAD